MNFRNPFKPLHPDPAHATHPAEALMHEWLAVQKLVRYYTSRGGLQAACTQIHHDQDRVRELEDELAGLRADLASLRKQLRMLESQAQVKRVR